MHRCAQCLGLLGAIDPSRVQPELPRPLPFSYDAQQFLVCLVQDHLVRVLQTASDISQLEMTSYALQQILQHFSAKQLQRAALLVKVGDQDEHQLLLAITSTWRLCVSLRRLCLGSLCTAPSLAAA